MMINGAAFSSHGEVRARSRLSSPDAPPAPASSLPSGGAPGSSITLEPEVPIDLGSMNGKPIEMRILHEGGYEWSGQPRIRSIEGEEITIEQILAARAARVFSRDEHEAVTSVLGIVHGLYLLTNGIWPIELLNAYVAEFASPDAARESVRRLGLDPDGRFTVNGWMLRLLGGRFVAWVEEG